jgi:hypothetical protein
VIVEWKCEDVRVLQTRTDRFSVFVELSTPGSAAWWLTAVYGPTCDDLKGVFLDELRMLRATLQGPWAVTGDFNLIVDARDKNTPVVNRRSLNMFRRCLNDLELKESTLLGRRFTWSNERASPTLVKLDRWFVSLEWDELHPSATLTALSSSLSDHCPIFMSTAVEPQVGKRFRFERFWLSLDGFADTVKDLWDNVNDDSPPANPLLRLAHKLRHTSRGLESWSRRKTGSIRDLILVANEIILRLEVAQESQPLATAEIDLRRSLKLKILGLASLERTIARQRARVAGIKAGDASAQFFRILATGRRQRNCINSLRSGDHVVVGLEDKLRMADVYFPLLFL